MTPVGLLAGAGRFPIAFAEKARACGIPVVCIGVPGMAEPNLADACTHFHWLNRFSMKFMVRRLRRHGVRQWAMAGKFHKHILFRPGILLRLLPDLDVIRFWFFHRHRRKDNKDDTILLAVIDEFRNRGFECVSPLVLCPELLVREGILTRRRPSAAECSDADFGWTLAREMGRLDIGQSVMIRNRAAIAVEAIEGTDLAIRRAGELCGGSPFTVVKVAKPKQDMRFDVPTIGPQTIESMHAAGARMLAIEAGRTIILDESETVQLADRYGISIVAKSDDQPLS